MLKNLILKKKPLNGYNLNNMNRKLASVQQIIKLTKIKGADKIVRADVLGWHLVVRKGEFKVGDSCVYFETDSLLPIRPEFEFLASTGVKTILGEDQKDHSGYRLKTIKLRGQISQGLALPISILTKPHKIGDDVTKELDVIKYEKLIPVHMGTKSQYKPVVFPNWLPVKIGMFIKHLSPTLAIKLWGQDLKPFPPYVPKTDEDRLQTVPNVLKRHKAKKFFITEKLDGSSITIFKFKGELGVCSRKIWYPKDENNQYWKAVINLDLENKLKEFDNIALQGELIGEKIQGNKLKIKGNKILFFNIFNISKNKYFNFKDFIKACKFLEIQTVPVLAINVKLPETVDKAVKMATIKSVINQDVWAEGIVFRPLIECQDKELGRLSFKVVNPEFLLQYGE